MSHINVGAEKGIFLFYLLYLTFGINGYYIDQPETPSSACNLYKFVGANDLSVNDIVVKSSLGSTICIKARFSLAIKVEALLENLSENNNSENKDAANGPNQQESSESPDDSSSDLQPSPSSSGYSNGDLKRENKMVLGYLPLDSVISVEDSCPETISPQKNQDTTTARPNNNNTPAAATVASADPKKQPTLSRQSSSVNDNNGGNNGEQQQQQSEPKELNMIVKFECGMLNFEFKKDETIYLSAIRGNVQLDSSTTRDFLVEKQTFFSSDFVHHFKFNDLIEVGSTTNAKGFILTANFYNLEFEAFRNTTSRSFIRPPDDDSKPFT